MTELGDLQLEGFGESHSYYFNETTFFKLCWDDWVFIHLEQSLMMLRPLLATDYLSAIFALLPLFNPSFMPIRLFYGKNFVQFTNVFRQDIIIFIFLYSYKEVYCTNE